MERTRHEPRRYQIAFAGPRGASPCESYSDFYRTGPYAQFPQEHRTGSSLGIEMIDVRQQAIETTDPALPQFSFIGIRSSSRAGAEFHFGDGWKACEAQRGIVDLQPAYTECQFRIPEVHLLLISILHAKLDARLDEVGTSLSQLDGPCGTSSVMPDALALMEGASRPAQTEDPSANLLVDGAITQLIGLMLHRAGRMPPPPPAIGDRRLQRVVDYVKAHIADPLTVAELAAVAHVSLFHFSRIFRVATGFTPHAYVTRLRIARAQWMLADPSVPLAQVAFICGFSSPGHFGDGVHTHPRRDAPRIPDELGEPGRPRAVMAPAPGPFTPRR